MIYPTAPSIEYPPFEGGPPDNPATVDVIRFARAADPRVMEQQINVIGQTEAGLGRFLAGHQLGGGGKGEHFAAALLFSKAAWGTKQKFAVGSGNGIRAFCFGGDSAVAIANNKELARQRAAAFASGYDTLEYRGCEISGANEGMTAMGMFIVLRHSEQ
jgi:hypothetical protein